MMATYCFVSTAVVRMAVRLLSCACPCPHPMRSGFGVALSGGMACDSLLPALSMPGGLQRNWGLAHSFDRVVHVPVCMGLMVPIS